MRILIVVVFLFVVAGVAVAGYLMDHTTLPPDEIDRVEDSCGKCHSNLDRLKDDGVHRRHKNADCITCHVDADGLETADNAHNAMVWAGIGVIILTAACLGVNYAVVRKRLKTHENDHEEAND